MQKQAKTTHQSSERREAERAAEVAEIVQAQDDAAERAHQRIANEVDGEAERSMADIDQAIAESEQTREQTGHSLGTVGHIALNELRVA